MGLCSDPALRPQIKIKSRGDHNFDNDGTKPPALPRSITLACSSDQLVRYCDPPRIAKLLPALFKSPMETPVPIGRPRKQSNEDRLHYKSKCERGREVVVKQSLFCVHIRLCTQCGLEGREGTRPAQ
jgi:hypothetical protein